MTGWRAGSGEQGAGFVGLMPGIKLEWYREMRLEEQAGQFPTKNYRITQEFVGGHLSHPPYFSLSRKRVASS
mgnify:CR=1 FL=1